MRSDTKRLVAALAVTTAIMSGVAVSGVAAFASTDTGSSANSSIQNVIEFKGAAVVSVSADKITIKTAAHGTVTVKIGKDTEIKGKLVVGAKADVYCVKVSAELVATLIVVLD